MKRIRDERLKVRNLKNIRIAFAVENILIILILIWQLYQKKPTNPLSYSNPLYAVLMIGALTLITLSINVTAPTEDKPKSKIKKISLHFLIALIVAMAFFYFLLFRQTHFIASFVSGCVVAVFLVGMELYSNHFRE